MTRASTMPSLPLEKSPITSAVALPELSREMACCGTSMAERACTGENSARTYMPGSRRLAALGITTRIAIVPVPGLT